MLLGGKTATLNEGHVTQFDNTIDVYNRPSDLLTAQTFSDPPMNILPVKNTGGKFAFHDSHIEVPKNMSALADGDYKIGVRPHHVHLKKPKGKSMELNFKVSTTEITGSESFIHLQSKDAHMVALMHGVHRVNIGDVVPTYLDQKSLFIFDQNENLISAPASDNQN